VVFIGNRGNTSSTVHPRLIAKDIVTRAASRDAQPLTRRPAGWVISLSRAPLWWPLVDFGVGQDLASALFKTDFLAVHGWQGGANGFTQATTLVPMDSD
jgi:hypothetical protein